jgi:rhomboid protease GluP
MRITFCAPLTLLIAALCAAVTYLPGAAELLGARGSLGGLFSPLNWARLLSWPFAHGDTLHLLANLSMLLLLGPIVEVRLGKVEYLFSLAATAIFVGLVHATLGSGLLIGASGWVFMLILLSGFASSAKGLPFHTLLVAIIYMGHEIVAALSSADNISRLAHLAGGLCGLAFGLLGSGGRQPAPPSSDPLAAIR